MIKRLLLIISVLSGLSFSVNAQERIPDREKYNWQEFQDKSIVIKDSIDFELLQGNWISYQGKRIGDYEIGWTNTGKPMSLQIKGDQYRNTLTGDFFPFLIDKNLIVFQGEDSTIDSAYINLITDKDLIISFRKGIDFAQHQYKK